MIGLIGGIVLPGIALWVTLRAWGPDWVSRSRTVQGVVAACFGLGASGLTSFWLVAAGGALDRTFIAADLMLWASVVLLSFAWMRRRQPHANPCHCEADTPHARYVAWWVKGAFFCVAGISLAGAVLGYITSPHGDWDAWAIWNQKARFLLRAGEAWVEALSIGWSQPGHPLLLPSSVARLWAYSGEETTLVPALVGVMFGGAAVALVMATLGTERRRSWIAGAVILAPGVFPREWTAQQADVPFAFFMVASLAMLIRARSIADPGGLFLLGGAAAGMAAWTKNEGLVLIGATAILACATALRAGQVRHALWWFAGAIPGLATLAWFKLAIAPEAAYYLPDAPLRALFEERLSSGHVSTVNGAIWQRLLAWGGPTAPGAMLVAGILAGVAAVTRSGAAQAIAAAIAAMASAYYLVYMLTSLDVTWLIATTFDRLLVQLWPSAVLAAFVTFGADSARVRQTA